MLAKPASKDGKMYKKGTILVTSTTSAFRGSAKGIAFAAGKMACRAVTQSVTKGYQKKGIHVCSIRLDMILDGPRVKAAFGDEKHAQALAADKLGDPDDVAETYYSVSQQPMVRLLPSLLLLFLLLLSCRGVRDPRKLTRSTQSALSNEIDLRPYTEDWNI